VPGAAIAIVRNDTVIYAKGYGVREVGKPDPVTARSIFAIGSATKAFTATLAAMLVDEGRLRWDDPVVALLPSFQLGDPWVTRQLTLRDLLAHRTGLTRHEYAWYRTSFDREELVRRRILGPLGMTSTVTSVRELGTAAPVRCKSGHHPGARSVFPSPCRS